MSTASRTSWISSANSGWRSQYSLMVGFSPRLQRTRNSSARSSTGLRSSLGEDMALLPVLVEEPGGGLEYVAQTLQGTNVAVAGGRWLQVEHLCGLFIGEFL